MRVSVKGKLPNSDSGGFIIAQIDAGNSVLESDEENNIVISSPLN
jgi:hypothetical protein